jgi:type IV secretion system protein VirB10
MRTHSIKTLLWTAASLGLILSSRPAFAQAPAATPAPTASDEKAAPIEKAFLVDIGTHIPLSMVNSVSTKHSQPGDRVYLETTFPISINNRIVIPAGSYVMGTITNTKRPGKVKGKGEFFLRFDSLMLPNGVTRDFRARVSALDGRASEDLDKDEGVVRSEGNKAGDVRTVGETAAWGASIGGLAGIGRAPGMGVGIGAAAGAAAGVVGMLLTRGPDAVLAKGTTVEMVLDRQVTYEESELDFSKAVPNFGGRGDGGGPLPSVKNQQNGRRF